MSALEEPVTRPALPIVGLIVLAFALVACGDVSVSGRNVDSQGQGGVKGGGRSVSVTGSTDVTVDGGLLGVLKARLVRIN